MNAHRLAEIIKAKRQADDLGLREVATITGISAPTLSRLERGVSLPDTKTMTKLAAWLDVSMHDLLFGEDATLKTAQGLSTPAAVAVLLRADERLSPEAVDALMRLFRVAYEQLATRRPAGGE